MALPIIGVYHQRRGPAPEHSAAAPEQPVCQAGYPLGLGQVDDVRPTGKRSASQAQTQQCQPWPTPYAGRGSARRQGEAVHGGFAGTPPLAGFRWVVIGWNQHRNRVSTRRQCACQRQNTRPSRAFRLRAERCHKDDTPRSHVVILPCRAGSCAVEAQHTAPLHDTFRRRGVAGDGTVATLSTPDRRPQQYAEHYGKRETADEETTLIRSRMIRELDPMGAGRHIDPPKEVVRLQ